MANVIDIEGVGSAMAEKLENAGVKSIDDLLSRPRLLSADDCSTWNSRPDLVHWPVA